MRCFMKAVYVVAVCVSCLCGCGKGRATRPDSNNLATTKTVRVARAELRSMTQIISVTGTLAAQEKSTLSAKVAGRLQFLPVDIGTAVRESDILAQIEARD